MTTLEYTPTELHKYFLNKSMKLYSFVENEIKQSRIGNCEYTEQDLTFLKFMRTQIDNLIDNVLINHFATWIDNSENIEKDVKTATREIKKAQDSLKSFAKKTKPAFEVVGQIDKVIHFFMQCLCP